ncbi:50S ribosomal protein L10 [Patescibacteria group bacterium]|nr:50S ribosomal protein L10 [Patescibacteria group bacterium]MBU1705743.1 50S ribosomal protein L10 [Patescibacteria group bacterium]
MPKTKQQKEQMVDELAEKLSRIKSAVFTRVSGYTMEDADALRTKGREQGVELAITKKTLLVRALEKAGVKLDINQLTGSVLTSLGYEDEVSPAKIMADYAKGREGVELIGGILEGAYVESDSVKALSQLPGKQELLAQLVGSLNAPTSGFVNVLAGNFRKLVYALNAIKDAKA